MFTVLCVHPATGKQVFFNLVYPAISLVRENGWYLGGVTLLVYRTVPLLMCLGGVWGNLVYRAIFLLKVHKRENFLGFDFEICTFS